MGSWLGAQKAEVAVAFPVNTQLQRVGGERSGGGYAEATRTKEKKKTLSESQNGSEINPHTLFFHPHGTKINPFFYSFIYLQGIFFFLLTFPRKY